MALMQRRHYSGSRPLPPAPAHLQHAARLSVKQLKALPLVSDVRLVQVVARHLVLVLWWQQQQQEGVVGDSSSSRSRSGRG